MASKKVVTKGGGHNLFKVSSSGGKYNVYQILVSIPFDDRKYIGSANSFEDALSIIRTYSGNEIKEIRS